MKTGDAPEGGNQPLRVAARVGLIARAVFYLVLVGLVVRISLLGNQGSHQADANGALSIISGNPVGEAAILIAVAGFVLFGVARLRSAVVDHEASRLSRASTVLQGLGSFAVAAVPASYAFGKKSSGSEQSSQKNATKLLGLPGGQVWAILLGLIILGFCVWQVRTALQRDWRDGLATEDSAPWVRKVITAIGTTGIAARAVVISPIGVLLIVAAATYQPKRFHGLDGELLILGQHVWGRLILILVALGLLDFALYALVEARWRRLTTES